MDLTASARQRLDAVVRQAPRTVVGLDFDGTLSPIVDDPREAHIHPDAPATLLRLAGQVQAIAVVTGRPARQVIALGGLDALAEQMNRLGRELFVLGQYGNERWSSRERRIVSPRPPAGLSGFLAELPSILKSTGVDPWIEEKGIAVGLHTRRLPDPAAAYAALLPPVRRAAETHGLQVEPGRLIIEVRAPGMDKGQAVRRLAASMDAKGFVFAGDDLGDVEAFAEVARLREDGLATLLVCSSSDEESVLAPMSDVIVPGPAGVLGFLDALAEQAAAVARS